MATITVQSTTIPNYQGGGSTATIRIYATENFFGGGVEYVAGLGYFYKEVACTVAGTTISVPSFTLESTTDSTNDSAKYIAVLYNSLGAKATTLLGGIEFSVSPVNTDPTWTELMIANQAVRRRLPDTYYTSQQTDILLEALDSDVEDVASDLAAETLARVNADIALQENIDDKQDTLVSGTNIKTVNNSSLLGSGNLVISDFTKLSQYADFAAAVTAIGATQKVLLIDADSTVSTAVTVPNTLTLFFVDGKKLTKSGSGTVTFQGRGITGDPVHQLFSGFSLGNITWSGAMPTFRPEWFGAVGDGVTDDLIPFNHFWNIQGAPSTQHTKIVLASNKTYYLSDTLEMDVRFTLQGEGEGDYWSPSAKMVWPDDKRGLVIHSLSTKAGISNGRSAEGSRVVSVFLQGGGGFYGFTPTHTVDVSGLTITKTAGEDYTAANGYAAGISITIGGFHYLISGVSSSTEVTLYKPRLLVRVPVGLTTVTAADFNNTYPTDGSWDGQQIAIDGSNYTIDTVGSTTTFTLSSAYSGVPNTWAGFGSGVVTAADAGTDTLTAAGHLLTTGQAVGFYATTGAYPAPLSVRNDAAGTGVYYAIVVDGDNFKLASSYADAIANTPIDLTDVGSGNHSYQVGQFVGDAELQTLATESGKSARSNKFHGIHAKAACEIRNCNIQLWHGAGIAMDTETGVTAHPGTTPNVNNSRIDKNAVYYTLGSGIWAKGVNSNQMVIINNDVSNAYGGAGIFEGSFLGNNYFSNHTSFNWFGAVYGDGAVNVSQFYGHYDEGGQPSAVLDTFMKADGGNWAAGIAGGGLVNQAEGATTVRALKVTDRNTTSTVVTSTLVGPNQPNTILGFGASDDAGNIGSGGSTQDVRIYAYQLGYNQLKTGWYNLYYGGNYASHQANSVLAFSGVTAAEGGGNLWLRNGFYLGASGSRSHLSNSGSGVILLRNEDLTAFNRIQLGGTTSSFPAIKRNSAGVDVRLADDSAYTTLTASSVLVDDDAYGVGWNGSFAVPTKNAVYDKIESLGMVVGNSVSGGGASRVLYEDGSQNLAASTNLTFASNQLRITGDTALSVYSASGSFFVNTLVELRSQGYAASSYLGVGDAGSAAMSILTGSGNGSYLRIGDNGAATFPIQLYTGGAPTQRMFLSCGNAASKGVVVQMAATPTANPFEIQNSSGTPLSGFNATGAWEPPSMADSAAENNSVYFSTDASALVYKDSGGTPRALY